MDDNRRIARTPGVLEAEVDGDRVLMHPDDYTYYGLTETGAAVWSLIDGTRSVADVVAALAEEYDATPAVIRTDVESFLSGMEAAKLVTYGT
ncbi:MAG: PqqD family peptide modification chaperone [Actinomycetales bacterium]|nr:PqqD family peptide modification chaperone [Actinomycetales bacterium]